MLLDYEQKIMVKSMTLSAILRATVGCFWQESLGTHVGQSVYSDQNTPWKS